MYPRPFTVLNIEIKKVYWNYNKKTRSISTADCPRHLKKSIGYYITQYRNYVFLSIGDENIYVIDIDEKTVKQGKWEPNVIKLRLE